VRKDCQSSRAQIEAGPAYARHATHPFHTQAALHRHYAPDSGVDIPAWKFTCNG
jgi:hypothetical protein